MPDPQRATGCVGRTSDLPVGAGSCGRSVFRPVRGSRGRGCGGAGCDSRPMTLLMTADPIGGVWAYALELSRALGALGADVAIATLGAPLSREQRAEAQALPNVSLYESTYRLEWMPSPWESLGEAAAWLMDLER